MNGRMLFHYKFLQEYKNISAIDDKIYSTLAQHAIKNNNILPSYEFLAKQGFCSIFTVKNSLRKLLSLGLIRIETSQNSLNTYHILEHPLMQNAQEDVPPQLNLLKNQKKLQKNMKNLYQVLGFSMQSKKNFKNTLLKNFQLCF